MITQIIGCYCLFHAAIVEIALIASVVQDNNAAEGARARANFMAIGYLAIAAWCFK